MSRCEVEFPEVLVVSTELT